LPELSSITTLQGRWNKMLDGSGRLRRTRPLSQLSVRGQLVPVEGPRACQGVREAFSTFAPKVEQGLRSPSLARMPFR
jgi:hypothetical protein